MAKFTINLSDKQTETLAKAMTNPDYPNSYRALEGQLSRKNKATLRGLIDTTEFISDRDLIWSIIDSVSEDDEEGLDL